MGNLSAALSGYHYVFLTMLAVEIVGLFLALALKNTVKKDAKA